MLIKVKLTLKDIFILNFETKFINLINRNVKTIKLFRYFS